MPLNTSGGRTWLSVERGCKSLNLLARGFSDYGRCYYGKRVPVP